MAAYKSAEMGRTIALPGRLRGRSNRSSLRANGTRERNKSSEKRHGSLRRDKKTPSEAKALIHVVLLARLKPCCPLKDCVHADYLGLVWIVAAATKSPRFCTGVFSRANRRGRTKSPGLHQKRVGLLLWLVMREQRSHGFEYTVTPDQLVEQNCCYMHQDNPKKAKAR